MHVVGFSPRPELAPFVRGFTIVETDAAATRTLLPETSLIAGVRYRGAAHQLDEAPLRLPEVTLAGLRDSPRVMATSAGGGIVLAMLREGRAGALFREPLHEVFGATVALDQLAPRAEVARLHEQVAEATDHAARVRAFEAFLMARLARLAPRAQGAPEDPVVDAAVCALRASHGALRIEPLAERLALSRDRLEKRFRRAVGSSPKQLAALLRLHRAIALHRAGASLTRVSAEAGYYDQPHFIREFRRFTGAAPGRVLSSDAYC